MILDDYDHAILQLVIIIQSIKHLMLIISILVSCHLKLAGFFFKEKNKNAISICRIISLFMVLMLFMQLKKSSKPWVSSSI